MSDTLPVQYLSEPQAGSAAGVGFEPVPLSTAHPLSPGSYSGTFDHGLVGRISNFELMDLIQMFVVYAFIIAAALAAIFIFVGGISFILSGGNDDKIRQAVNTIRYAIVGLIITILSFTFVTIVGRMFGLNFLDYISYGQIKNAINRVVTGEEQSYVPLPGAPDLNTLPIIDSSASPAGEDYIVPAVAPLPKHSRPVPSGSLPQ